jgi:hypothetical protein
MRMMNDDESWDLYMLCMFMSFWQVSVFAISIFFNV